MSKINTAALQQYWANLMVEELIRSGVDYFCCSPGSRSTPLALAVAGNKKAKSFVHFDERAVAYHAMGYAAASHGGSAIITTSGTAVANLLPAVVEASKKKLPLIILTADRPPELRYTGANQTIEQVDIFGPYVRWNFDFPVPDENIKPAFVLTTIDQAVHRSKGEWPGPVHLNCMFREPLFSEKKMMIPKTYKQDLDVWVQSSKPFTNYERSSNALLKEKTIQYVDILNRSDKGIIVAGKLSDQSQSNVLKLAEKLNWPIFPDITSGLRLGQKSEHIIFHFDQLIDHVPVEFDTVLHLGGRITSKRYAALIVKNKPKNYIMVLNHPLRNDPQHHVTHRVQCHTGDFCQAIVSSIQNKPRPASLTRLKKYDIKISEFLDKNLVETEGISEPGVCRWVTRIIPATNALYSASSLPIRELDMFANHNGAAVPVGANRGASGIDGTIASAAGYSMGADKRVTLINGDLAFLYDLNALSMLKDIINPMTVIVLNNDGGGIFEFFPVSKLKNTYTKFFETPHGLTFQKAAELFNLNYAQSKSMSEFKKDYAQAIKSKDSTIIEIQTNKKENFELQQKLRQQIKKFTNNRGE